MSINQIAAEGHMRHIMKELCLQGRLKNKISKHILPIKIWHYFKSLYTDIGFFFNISTHNFSSKKEILNH